MGDGAQKWMAIQRRKRSERLAQRVKRALTDEEVRARLQLTDEDLKVLEEAIHRPKRHVGSQLLALKLKIASTVRPPEQTVRGEMAVNVVVNTLKRDGYRLPAETSDGTGGLLRGAEDAEQV